MDSSTTAAPAPLRAPRRRPIEGGPSAGLAATRIGRSRYKQPEWGGGVGYECAVPARR
ncbi:hypothetical protein GCM10020001_095450 [Nonomuraea salmonea]